MGGYGRDEGRDPEVAREWWLVLPLLVVASSCATVEAVSSLPESFFPNLLGLLEAIGIDILSLISLLVL